MHDETGNEAGSTGDGAASHASRDDSPPDPFFRALVIATLFCVASLASYPLGSLLEGGVEPLTDAERAELEPPPDPAPVPESENAVPLLVQIDERLAAREESRRPFNVLGYWLADEPERGEMRKIAIELVEEETIDEVDRALERPRLRLPLPSFDDEDFGPYLRQVYALISIEHRVAMERGELERALGATRRCVRFAEGYGSGGRHGAHWRIGSSFRFGALEAIRDLARDPRADAELLTEVADLSEAVGVGAAEEVCDALREDLRFERALLDEELGDHHSSWAYSRRDTWARLDRDALRRIRRVRTAAAGFPALPSPRGDPFEGRRDPWTMAEWWLQGNSVGRIVLRLLTRPEHDDHLRLLETECVATRTEIALRRHALAHGEYPAALADLVPEFLPAVPDDPYGDGPLRYSRERRVLWSVGDDGFDEGGHTEPGLRVEWTVFLDGTED